MAVYPIPKSSVDWIKGHLSEQYSARKAKEKYQEIVKTYEGFVMDSPDIGGKKNPMSKNFYGSLSAFAYYECTGRSMTSEEITRMCVEMVVRDARVGPLAKFNLNNKLIRGILHGLFGLRARKLNKHKADGSWNNTWGMKVNPLNHQEGISIHLVGCPICDFANSHGYGNLMPYFCKADIAVMESFGGVLFREHTVAEGYEDCDYWIKNREKRDRYESRL